MMRRGARTVLALGAVVLLVACTTSYGEEVRSAGPDASISDAGSGAVDASIPEDDASTPPPDGGSQSDARDDAAVSYVEACPPCPQTDGCIAAGCSGAGTRPNACSAPFDVTAPMNLVAFVCPEGPTVDFPEPCVPGGGTKALHVAVFRMGMSGGTKGNWRVTAKGTNAFVSVGTCGGLATACAGGTNGPSQARSVDAFATAMIGTTSKLSSCEALLITIDDDS